MSDISTTLLTYLLQHRIIDENSANKIKELIKQDSHKVIGEVLVENSFFTKEELLTIILDFFKKGYIALEDVNVNFAIEIEKFLASTCKNFSISIAKLTLTSSSAI